LASRGIGDTEAVQCEPAVAADGAGTTAFRGMTPFQPAPLLSGVYYEAMGESSVFATFFRPSFFRGTEKG